MANTELNATVISFRLRRAEEFARQWRINANRLQSLASNPRTPEALRANAHNEAREAAEIVHRRAVDLAELAHARGYNAWEADPMIGPLVVEIRAVENALTFAAEALGKAS